MHMMSSDGAPTPHRIVPDLPPDKVCAWRSLVLSKLRKKDMRAVCEDLSRLSTCKKMA